MKTEIIKKTRYLKNTMSHETLKHIRKKILINGGHYDTRRYRYLLREEDGSEYMVCYPIECVGAVGMLDPAIFVCCTDDI